MPIGVFPGKVWFDDVLPYDSKFSTGRHLFGACYKQNRREMNKLNMIESACFSAKTLKKDERKS